MAASFHQPGERPAGGPELWSWVFMRISGVVLLGLALGHLVVMHLINNVDAVDFNFVANRYRGWFWRSYDGLLLVLALIHGLNGARILIDDYVHPLSRRRIAVAGLYLVGAVFLVLGLSVVFFFTPPAQTAGVAL
ncbi:MAG: succinate dehydrogenase [Candidatus Omnitrophica bacterium]|nr:succinate dehydrogenase [Candidatus Omnitrophota bacterium]